MRVTKPLHEAPVPLSRAAVPSAFAGLFTALSFVSTLAGCDDKPKETPKDAAPAVTASATASAAPKEPESTTISMDDAAVTINGARVPFEGADPRVRIATELGGKPKVAGEVVPLVVMRPAKATKVAIAVAALKDAKAKSVVIRGQKRDGQMAEIPITFGASAPCVAAAAIGKDVAINVWTIGGTTARRFAKGMAGPDLTLGSEGFRKAIAACDTKVAVVTADESVTWGLLYDLALTTKEDPDPKTKDVAFALTVETAVAGRKVTPL